MDVRDLVRSLDWRSELLGLLLVLAETMLVYLAAGFLLSEGTVGGDVVPLWIVALLMLTAHLVPHLCDEWRVFTPTYEVVMTAGILLSAVVAIKAGAYGHIALWDPFWLQDAARSAAFLSNDAARPFWGIVALAVWAWWRGRSRAEPAIDTAYTMLRYGSLAAALLLILILVGAQEEAIIRDRLTGGIIGFYVLALASVGVARLRLEGFRTSGPLGVRWLTTFIMPIVAVVMVAVIGAGIFSRSLLDTVLLVLSPVFWVLSLVFEVLIVIIAVIAFLIITPIVWLIGEPEQQAVQNTPAAEPPADQSQLERATDSALQAPDALRYLVAALVIFLLVAALTKFVFRRRPRERDTVGEERESVLDWNDLAGSLLNRLRGLRPRRATDPLAHLRDDPQWRYTVAIREAWLQLQARGAEVGRARRAGETTEEYRRSLLPHTPYAAAAVAPASPTARARASTRRASSRSVEGDPLVTLAQQYRTARYSGTPATAEDAAAVEQALRAIGDLAPDPASPPAAAASAATPAATTTTTTTTADDEAHAGDDASATETGRRS